MTLTNLTKELDHLNKYGDGELILRNHSVIWNLYVARGQLLYAIGEVHPVRRWDRARSNIVRNGTGAPSSPSYRAINLGNVNSLILDSTKSD